MKEGRGPVVVHLAASNFFGGPERQIVEHAAALPPARYRAVVGSWREGRPAVDLVERAAARGIATFLVETPRPWDPRAVRELGVHLDRVGAALVACHGYKADLHGHLAARRRGLPRVGVLRGLTGEDRKVRFYEWLYRFSLRRADRVVVVSRATARVARRMGVPGDRVVVIPNAWHPPPEPVVPRDPRALGGFPPGEPVLLAAGRLSPEKGQDLLLAALARLAGRGVPFRAVLCGEGPLRGLLEGEIRDRDLGERVLLAGFRDDLPGLLAGADLLVNPSRSEGLPNVVLEAFGAGTAVVATAVGGVPELVEDGETGWLVPAGDPERLAAAIADALARPGERDRRARAAHALLEREYSPSRQLERWLELYDALRGPGY